MSDDLISDISTSILSQFRQFHEDKLKSDQAQMSKKPVVFQSLVEMEEEEKRNSQKLQRKRPVSKLQGSEEEPKFHQGLQESDVGITEYLTSTKGFSGIIKHRFSDFNVNEIRKNGDVIELTSKEIPQEEVEPENDEEEQKCRAFATEDQWSVIEKMSLDPTFKETIELDVTARSKEERGLLHRLLKKIYAGKIYSNTLDKDNKKIILIGRANKAEEIRWPKRRGMFLHFTLYKENKDTSEVVQILAKHLRTKPNYINYAGMKDKRGRTTQRMSVKHRTAEQLSNLKFRNIEVGNFSYEHSSVRLGCLKGNRFRLAMREVIGEDDDIKESLKNLQETGFVNYYGLQRFGNSVVVPTYAIGKALLACDWQGAVELMLKPREGEKCFHNLREAKEHYALTKDSVAAAKKLHRHDRSLEGKVLKSLSETGSKDFFRALSALPRNVLTLYLHSYQGLLWNRIVSRRIREFGHRPVPGDLVFDLGFSKEDDEGDDDDDDENDDSERPSKESHEPEGPKKSRDQVRHLSEDDVKTTSLKEVVYPLPGFDVIYPNNDIAKWYDDALAEDGLTLEKLKNSHKTFSISGAYRKVVGEVRNLHWSIVKYKDLNDDLILSDEERLRGCSLPEPPEDAVRNGVIMEFSLKKSMYATMVLRELTKSETSVSHHTALTLTHQERRDEFERKKQKQE